MQIFICYVCKHVICLSQNVSLTYLCLEESKKSGITFKRSVSSEWSPGISRSQTVRWDRTSGNLLPTQPNPCMLNHWYYRSSVPLKAALDLKNFTEFVCCVVNNLALCSTLIPLCLRCFSCSDEIRINKFETMTYSSCSARNIEIKGTQNGYFKWISTLEKKYWLYFCFSRWRANQLLWESNLTFLPLRKLQKN